MVCLIICVIDCGVFCSCGSVFLLIVCSLCRFFGSGWVVMVLMNCCSVGLSSMVCFL